MTRKVAEALAEGRAQLAAAGVALPELEAQVLLAHAAGTDRTGLVVRSADALSEAARARYAALLEGRLRRIPVAYLTGEREFWSLRFAVDARVLVPRPETETLVEAARQRLTAGSRAVEIGTGSGAVVLALASELRDVSWWATDISAEALDVARANAAVHGLAERVSFHHGDLFAPLTGLEGRFDAVISNPPYVPSAEIEGLDPDVRDHEPRQALDGGADGLRVIVRLLDEAPRFLRGGGWLLLELGAGQASAVREIALRRGAWESVETVPDLAGVARVAALRAA